MLCRAWNLQILKITFLWWCFVQIYSELYSSAIFRFLCSFFSPPLHFLWIFLWRSSLIPIYIYMYMHMYVSDSATAPEDNVTLFIEISLLQSCALKFLYWISGRRRSQTLMQSWVPPLQLFSDFRSVLDVLENLDEIRACLFLKMIEWAWYITFHVHVQ